MLWKGCTRRRKGNLGRGKVGGGIQSRTVFESTVDIIDK